MVDGCCPSLTYTHRSGPNAANVLEVTVLRHVARSYKWLDIQHQVLVAAVYKQQGINTVVNSRAENEPAY